jgi:hypothetical protein
VTQQDTAPLPPTRPTRDQIVGQMHRFGVTAPSAFAYAAFINSMFELFPATPTPSEVQASKALTEDERDEVESAQYYAEKNPTAWWSETFFKLIDIINRLTAKASTQEN